MKRLLSGYSQNNSRDGSQVPRGTPSAWLARWQLASRLQDRLEMICGDTNPRFLLRLTRVSRSYRELVRAYSNDGMR